MKHLLDLYQQFAKALEPKIIEAEGDIYLDEYQKAPEEQIAELSQHSSKLPEELLYFWQNLPFVLSAEVPNAEEDTDSAYIGFDFYSVELILRDLPDFRGHTQYLDKQDAAFLISLHEQGIPLSYSEPHLVYFPTDGKIYFRLYDGDSPLEPIADSFTEFFEHYLAAGCFCSHSFDHYWELVQDIVPIQIPLEENKWLNFYIQLYKH